MAMKIQKEDHTSLTIEINNGDFKALSEIKNKMGFKDKESVLRYALAVLKFAEEGDLFLERKDGTAKILKPVDDLLEHPGQEGEMHG